MLLGAMQVNALHAASENVEIYLKSVGMNVVGSASSVTCAAIVKGVIREMTVFSILTLFSHPVRRMIAQLIHFL